MKKIFLSLFTILSLSAFTISCSSNDDDAVLVQGDGDTIADVYEITDSFNNQYTIQKKIPTIYTTDHILIYRLSGTNNTGKDVWQLIPRTFYLDDVDGNGSFDELDYDYDFSIEDFVIYVRGTYDLELTPEFLDNQTFRIVVIPGKFSAFGSTPTVDFNNYNAVIKYYNIDESKIIKK